MDQDDSVYLGGQLQDDRVVASTSSFSDDSSVPGYVVVVVNEARHCLLLDDHSTHKHSQWANVHGILDQKSPFAAEGFSPGDETKDFLHHSCKVLVIGAGGLGCELLKDLALMGFRDIHVIDMDTIDISNLNRQFLFRESDVGQPKATVAARFIMSRIPDCRVTPYFGKIQDKNLSYYADFDIIICGLDSVEARRWINATIVSLYDEEDPSTMKPIVDGGTEGFKGQSRVIFPKLNACYECSLAMQTKPATFPVCTIANTPRQPEHCIQWANLLEWPKTFPDTAVDGDNPEHIQWIMETAKARGDQFHISGITYSLTQGVIKNIIPAIASTNAIVAASCANEAFKLVTSCSTSLNNYMMYAGDAGVYTYTFELEKKEDCPVCGIFSLRLTVKAKSTLQELIDTLKDHPEYRITNPSLRSESTNLYMAAPKVMEVATRPNLCLFMEDLIGSGEELILSDPALPIPLKLIVSFQE